MQHGGKRVGAGRPTGQGKYGTKTKAIRVPENLVEAIQEFSLNNGYLVPLFSSKVQAGDASFADNHIDQMVNINKLLIENPATTFCLNVSGLSMINADIDEGDMIIIDSSITPAKGKIIIALINGDVTVKRLGYIDGKPYLLPENANFRPIPIHENTELHILGVVTNVIKKV